MAGESWQDRLKAERKALVKKLDKLGLFIDSEEFAALPVPDQVLLKEQSVAMTHYLGVLDKRVRRIKPK